jgi:hypothetical protein
LNALASIIAAVYRRCRPSKANQVPPEERLRRREALRKVLKLRTLIYADLEWEIAEGNRRDRRGWVLLEPSQSDLRPKSYPKAVARPPVDGPFCPRCGRRLWGEWGRAWANTTWISIENPCKGCGREAQHPDLVRTSVYWLQNQVLRDVQQRGGVWRSGAEAGAQ